MKFTEGMVVYVKANKEVIIIDNFSDDHWRRLGYLTWYGEDEIELLERLKEMPKVGDKLVKMSDGTETHKKGWIYTVESVSGEKFSTVGSSHDQSIKRWAKFPEENKMKFEVGDVVVRKGCGGRDIKVGDVNVVLGITQGSIKFKEGGETYASAYFRKAIPLTSTPKVGDKLKLIRNEVASLHYKLGNQYVVSQINGTSFEFVGEQGFWQDCENWELVSREPEVQPEDVPMTSLPKIGDKLKFIYNGKVGGVVTGDTHVVSKVEAHRWEFEDHDEKWSVKMYWELVESATEDKPMDKSADKPMKDTPKIGDTLRYISDTTIDGYSYGDTGVVSKLNGDQWRLEGEPEHSGYWSVTEFWELVDSEYDPVDYKELYNLQVKQYGEFINKMTDLQKSQEVEIDALKNDLRETEELREESSNKLGKVREKLFSSESTVKWYEKRINGYVIREQTLKTDIVNLKENVSTLSLKGADYEIERKANKSEINRIRDRNISLGWDNGQLKGKIAKLEKSVAERKRDQSYKGSLIHDLQKEVKDREKQLTEKAEGTIKKVFTKLFGE